MSSSQEPGLPLGNVPDHVPARRVIVGVAVEADI
jgi:hypothetical protein